jgi:hypothetical protein
MPLQYIRESKTKRKNKRQIIKGGDGAADYGIYIWGVNQTNDPSQGNLIQPAHNPANPPPPTQTGGGAMDQVQQMMTPIVGNVTSQSAPSSSQPTTQSNVTGGKKTKRKRKSKRKSKRKYR